MHIIRHCFNLLT